MAWIKRQELVWFKIRIIVRIYLTNTFYGQQLQEIPLKKGEEDNLINSPLFLSYRVQTSYRLYSELLKIHLNPPCKGGRRKFNLFSPLFKGGWGDLNDFETEIEQE